MVCMMGLSGNISSTDIKLAPVISRGPVFVGSKMTFAVPMPYDYKSMFSTALWVVKRTVISETQTQETDHNTSP